MNILILVLIGFVIGGLSGLLGIGGGVLMVPALMYFRGMEQSKAAGTSLALLSLPVALPAAWHYYQESNFDPESVFWLAVAFAVGGYVGANLGFYLPERGLRFCFGMMMIYIAMRFILNSDNHAAVAMAGVTAVSLAWVSFWSLRVLGHRSLAKPSLQQEIREANERRSPDHDYSI